MSLENIKKALMLGLTAGEVIEDVSGRESSFSKAAALWPLIEEVPTLLSIDYSKLAEETRAITPEQLDELKSFIETEFSLKDADKEKMIEGALGVALDLAKVAQKALEVWKVKYAVPSEATANPSEHPDANAGTSIATASPAVSGGEESV